MVQKHVAHYLLHILLHSRGLLCTPYRLIVGDRSVSEAVVSSPICGIPELIDFKRVLCGERDSPTGVGCIMLQHAPIELNSFFVVL